MSKTPDLWNENDISSHWKGCQTGYADLREYNLATILPVDATLVSSPITIHTIIYSFQLYIFYVFAFCASYALDWNTEIS